MLTLHEKNIVFLTENIRRVQYWEYIEAFCANIVFLQQNVYAMLTYLFLAKNERVQHHNTLTSMEKQSNTGRNKSTQMKTAMNAFDWSSKEGKIWQRKITHPSFLQQLRICLTTTCYDAAIWFSAIKKTNEPTSDNTVSSKHFIRCIAHHDRFPLWLRAETKHPSGENLVFLGVFSLFFKGVENRARVYSFRRRGMFSYERQRQLFPLVWHSC